MSIYQERNTSKLIDSKSEDYNKLREEYKTKIIELLNQLLQDVKDDKKIFIAFTLVNGKLLNSGILSNQDLEQTVISTNKTIKNMTEQLMTIDEEIFKFENR